MIAKGFKSVIWAATVGTAALGCYMVSLRVATERNDLLKVERQILAAKRDIRSLQTELGTRGRMTQLEQWNSEVLALSAPSSAQYMKDAYTLARLDRPQPSVADRSAEVQMAAAEVPAAEPAAPPPAITVAPRPSQPAPMLRQASFTPAPAKVSPPAETAKVKAPTVKAKAPTDVATAAAETKPKTKLKAPTVLASASPAKARASAASTPPRPRLGKLAAEVGAAADRESGKGGGGR
jgi:hypothetical protein